MLIARLLQQRSEFYKRFFPHQNMYKYTRYKKSSQQLSMIYFCIVLVDIFSFLTDILVNLGAELSTDHQLTVCSLGLTQLMVSSKCRHKRLRSHRIARESFADKEVKELKQK